MESYVWIALGSALGGAGRHWCSGLVARRFGETFPWGTLVVNILGSFVVGFADALLTGTPARQLVMAGLCGGYTTFSAFSLQTLNLARAGKWRERRRKRRRLGRHLPDLGVARPRGRRRPQPGQMGLAMHTPGDALRDGLGPSAMLYMWIAVGSGIGGAARFWCAEMSAQLLGKAFPWGILLVNVAGSLVIGFFFTYGGTDGRRPVSTTARQFVMTGLCGGYTTFSAFSLDTLNLMRDGRLFAAGANVVLSLALCLLFVWLGHALAATLSRPARG